MIECFNNRLVNQKPFAVNPIFVGFWLIAGSIRLQASDLKH